MMAYTPLTLGADAMGELARLLDGDAMARPQRCGSGRDPSPVWDTWYEEFSSTDRRRLGPFMGGSVTPDVLAGWLHISVDDAMWQWRQAALAELKSLTHDPLEDDYAQAESAAMEEADNELFGINELAAYWDVKPGTIAVWRHRGKLPNAWRIISGTPIWRFGDIRRHIEDLQRTGRIVRPVETEMGAEHE
jgi:hypothetical protein